MLSALSEPVGSDVFLWTRDESVYGRIERHSVRPHESLIEIARDFDIGYNAIAEANRGVDPFVPGEATDLTIPMRWVLPDLKNPRGIVVNLSDFRLYRFYAAESERFVATFPVAIGDEGWLTPLGEFFVAAKVRRPDWTPPASIRARDPALPAVVASGPRNPLGSHALRLSAGSILIHGTNRPFGIGRKVSHGCIHLYPEDIVLLYRGVERGTPVTIVRQPVKVGTTGGRVFVEVHGDEDFDGDYLEEAVRLLGKKGLDTAVSMRKVEEATSSRSGIPADVTADDPLEAPTAR